MPDSPAPTPPSSVVVVGAGLAGAGTVTALRGAGWAGRITVLGAEGVPPYDRPPLSKELLTRTGPAWLVDEMGLDVTAADDVRPGTPATGLRTGGPDGPVTVVTDDGDVTADAVVVATGAHAVRPWPDALTLHTAADARRLRERLVPGARLVIVGAGWIGAEVAGVAARAGVGVTVVEAGPAPLATALGAQVGALTRPWYDAAGVRLVTGRSVTSVAPVGGAPTTGGATRGAAGVRPSSEAGPDGGPAGPLVVTLDDGEALEADVVLAAVGVRPATAWLADAVPLAPDGSVEVDDAFRAVAVDAPVIALGDAALRRSARHGLVPGGHWDGALKAPAVAVRRLLGDEPRPADDVAPYVFSTQLGHELALFGLPAADDDVVLRGDPADGFTVLWFRPASDELTAVLGVDRPHDVTAGRRLLAGPALPRLDRARAADPDVRLRDTVLT